MVSEVLLNNLRAGIQTTVQVQMAVTRNLPCTEGVTQLSFQGPKDLRQAIHEHLKNKQASKNFYLYSNNSLYCHVLFFSPQNYNPVCQCGTLTSPMKCKT